MSAIGCHCLLLVESKMSIDREDETSLSMVKRAEEAYNKHIECKEGK